MSIVTLHDGRQVDSYSEEWKIECLARWCLSTPIEARRAFLEAMDKRNRPTADKLRDVMTALHQQRKAA